MTTDIKYDQRYKVNKDIVSRMIKMREEGNSYQRIADYFNVSNHTAYYWINSKYRKEKRKYNCRKVVRSNEKERTKKKSRRRFEMRNVPEMRMSLRVQSAKNEYRCKRHTVLGKTLEEYYVEYEKTKKGGNKIGI